MTTEVTDITTAGGGLDVPVPAALELRGLCGDLVALPGEPAYAAARMPWNVALDQRPAAVAVPRSTDDVRLVVRSAAGIDRRGLHVTNIEALGRALEGLDPGEGAIALVDGFSLPRCRVPHRPVVQGDATSAAIAAASVVAKVTRDRYMREAALRHPGWGFEEHVGYSTPEHRAAIEEIGISPLHRRSFQSVAYQQLAIE